MSRTGRLYAWEWIVSPADDSTCALLNSTADQNTTAVYVAAAASFVEGCSWDWARAGARSSAPSPAAAAPPGSRLSAVLCVSQAIPGSIDTHAIIPQVNTFSPEGRLFQGPFPRPLIPRLYRTDALPSPPPVEYAIEAIKVCTQSLDCICDSWIP